LKYQAYIGVPYSEKNCADLAIDIQREVFKKNIKEYERPETNNIFELSQAIRRQLYDFTKPVKKPFEGALVLMRSRNRVNHIGTLFYQGKIAYVLHTSDAFGSSVVHKLNDLRRYQIEVVGFYQWR